MMRQIRVGGGLLPVSEVEWLLATLPQHTPIEWDGGGHQCPLSGSGTFKFSWFGRELMGQVDMNGEVIQLCPAINRGMTIRRADPLWLIAAGMHGDGI